MGVMEKFRLDGKVAWITGASYGLGMAYAKAYAEAGAKIVFNDINPDNFNRGMEEYKKAGIDAFGMICDVTKEDQVENFVKEVEKNVGPIDILVNNAGIIKAVLPHMMERRSGKIINACSMMSEFGRETVSAYAAAKGGLKMLTRNICSEYGQYNIQCNAIGPGYIATPQTAPLREKQADGSMHPFDRFIRSKTPAQRWGHTEDLMGLAVFLASPASDFINGQVVYIDGGISAYIGQDPSNLDESKFAEEVEVEGDIKVKD